MPPSQDVLDMITAWSLNCSGTLRSSQDIFGLLQLRRNRAIVGFGSLSRSLRESLDNVPGVCESHSRHL